MLTVRLPPTPTVSVRPLARASEPTLTAVVMLGSLLTPVEGITTWSLAPGAPLGDQLPAVAQAVLEAPVHTLLWQQV